MQIRCAYLSLFSHLPLLNASVVRISCGGLCLHLAAETHGLQGAEFDKSYGAARAAR
jgi:hypothetical protein